MEADTLATMITILVAVLGSSAITIGTVLKQMNHLDTKFTDKFDALDTKFTDKVTALDAKFTALDVKVTALGESVTELSEASKEQGRVLGEVRERLARVEGYLMPPGGFTLHRRSQAVEDPALEDPSTGDPGPDAPADDHRQAG